MKGDIIKKWRKKRGEQIWDSEPAGYGIYGAAGRFYLSGGNKFDLCMGEYDSLEAAQRGAEGHAGLMNQMQSHWLSTAKELGATGTIDTWPKLPDY